MAVKISALTSGTALTGPEQFEVVQSSVSVKATAQQIKTYVHQMVLTYRPVSNAFSETFGALADVMILFNAGTLAIGTVVMPASPIDGQYVRVTAAMTVTALTVSPNAGQTIIGAPTTISTTTPFGFIYRSTNATWYRIG